MFAFILGAFLSVFWFAASVALPSLNGVSLTGGL